MIRTKISQNDATAIDKMNLFQFVSLRTDEGGGRFVVNATVIDSRGFSDKFHDSIVGFSDEFSDEFSDKLSVSLIV